MRVDIKKHKLTFKQPSRTSRGVLTQKQSWFVILQKDGKIGVGECSLIQGLSPDARPDFEEKIHQVTQIFAEEEILPDLSAWPAIKMGFETALLSLKAPHWWEPFPSPFSRGEDFLPINGLVWMGSQAFMSEQIKTLLKNGYTFIKLKIGAIDFDQELDLIKAIRNEFSAREVTIRVDANGAFAPQEALGKLNQLSAFEIHSIEQPIAPNNFEEMAFLCQKSPLPIALDEELIGVCGSVKKEKILEEIQPQFLILKPSLLGGFQETQEWIQMAKKRNIGWWVTSALESNIGLNAIAQWTYSLNINVPQGLGTGSLFTNNIDLPLQVDCGRLSIEVGGVWNLNF
ncbi:MAG: o-succinylbenzoate synthase [Flavobacteriaceae bacterium]